MTLRTLILRTSLTIALIASLNSCKSFDTTVERCVNDQSFGICRCHDYRISNQFIGRVSESRNEPLNYCDRRVSFSPRGYVEVLDILRQFANRTEVESKEDLEKVLDKGPKRTHDRNSHHKY